MRYLFVVLMSVALVACTAGERRRLSPSVDVAHAVDTGALDLREAVEAGARTLLEPGLVQGMAIAFEHPHGSEKLFLGSVGSGGEAPTAETIFEIGSVTKVFTALALVELVGQGELELTAPVASLLTESFEIPDYEGVEISLEHLATHTSGLPSMPDNFRPADLDDPFSDYDEERLAEFLSAYDLPRVPGVRAEYSNLGKGLLGYALAASVETDYEELVSGLILDPMNLADTGITLDDEQRERLAQGHDGDGSPKQPWDLGSLEGAGALRSTLSDMLLFVRANLSMVETPVQGSFSLAQVIRGPFDESNTVGLGWLVSSEGVLWHNGQTGGYHSFVAFHPEEHIGLVVLANTATHGVTRLGIELMNLLRGRPYDLDVPVDVELPPELLERYVGRYQLAPGAVFTITLEDGLLHAQLTGQPAFPIYPVSETAFVYRAVPARIVFQLDEEGAVEGLVLHQGGQELPAPRMP